MKRCMPIVLCYAVLWMSLMLVACTADRVPANDTASATETETFSATETRVTDTATESTSDTVPETETVVEIETTFETDAETVAESGETVSAETKEEIMLETMPETGPDTIPVEDPALNVFPSAEKNIEIGIFWEPPADFTTPEQYDWIRDANITFIEVTNREADSHEIAQKQIALAKERGIRISYNPSRDGKSLMNMSDAEIVAYAEMLAEDPTVVGIHIIDEPANPWAYSRVCAAVSKGGLTPRLNFLPYWATWVFENYRGHVEDTVIATGKENYGYLCYDEYPFKYQSGSTPNMYYNMNLFREIGLKYNIPTGFYIQSIGEAGNFRRTNGDEIRYHTSAALAYGLKSLTYFTWWTTGFCDEKDYAIISPYGEKTDIYDDVAAVNEQILKTGPLLRRLDALEVYHTAGREDAIEIRKEEDSLPVYPSGGGLGFIVSLMEDPETGRDYIMLVNKNFKRAMNSTITVNEGITHLYNCTNGAYEEIDIRSGSFKQAFAPGGYILLAVGQHDNIVDRKWDAGANLAEGKPVSVHAVNPGAGFYAYCVTDGVRDNSDQTAQGFRSAQNVGYIEVDLGRVTTLNRVDIYPTGTNYDRGQNFPQSFTVAVSTDRETWLEVVDKSNYTDATNAIPVFTFDTVDARYVRLSVTEGAQVGGFEIGEIEIYNDDGTLPKPDHDAFYEEIGGEPAGTNVAFEKPMTASSAVGGWEPDNVVDGNKGSGWTSGLNRHTTENGQEWLMVDLLTSYELDRIVLTPRDGDHYFPKNYRIEISEDGKSFTEIYDGAHPDMRTGQNPIEIDLDGASGRYVRITGYILRDASGFNDGFLFSLMELEIYNQ